MVIRHMIYFSHLRPPFSFKLGLISTALLLTTALANPALAESLTEISPRQIASDVQVQYNPETGTREYIARSFDPFEENPEMAGTVNLRSVINATTINGQTIRGGALLDMTFYYSTPSSDPYDVKGLEEAVFLSGEQTSVIRRDNRVLECSEDVQDVVYHHKDYYSPSFHLGLYRPYRHYSGHHGFGHFGYDYGYGYGHGFSRGSRFRRGFGVGNRRFRNARRDRARDRRRDRDDGVNGSIRDNSGTETEGRRRDGRRGRHGDRVREGRRDNDGRRGHGRNRNNVDGNTDTRRRDGRRDRIRGERRNNGSTSRTDRSNDNRSAGQGASTPRTTSPRTSTPNVRTPRVRTPRIRTPRSARGTEIPRPVPRTEPSTPPRSQRSNVSRSQRIKSRHSPRRGGKNISRNRSIKMMSFLLMASAWSRNVVRNVDIQCAREEMLTVHISQDRLNAARFDGLTVLVLDRTGQEFPVFIPPNYIEGFRSAVEGRVTPTNTAPAYESGSEIPIYKAPVTPNVEIAPCPSGTTRQDDGTCLTDSAIGGYPRP